MQKPHIVLISIQEPDTQFFSAVARKLGYSFSQVSDRDALKAVLGAFPESIVIWSAEHPETFNPRHSGPIYGIAETLRKLIAPSHVFALTDKPMSRYPQYFEQTPFFQHQILRRYPEPAIEFFGKVFGAVLAPNPMGIKQYFPSGVGSSQMVTLKCARHRAMAVDVVQKFFQKKGIKARLAARVAQATDELLMNAIFNAPHTASGNPTRKMTERGMDFDFGKNELVQMEIIVAEQYVGVCVTDQFGALDREVVMRLMSKNYHDKAYTPKDSQRGAGLGIYGIMEMGFSLLFVVKPGSRTDAMIFFPITGSFKNFREGFQLIGYLGGPTFKKTAI